MGSCLSRNKTRYNSEKDPMIFIQKMRFLQQDVSVMLKQREEEREAYEREMMVFAFKEADWKKEKKEFRDEVRGLRRKLEKREKRVREMEEEVGSMSMTVGESEKSSEGVLSVESGTIASLLMVEKMREERARRDETIEKWKMLYLAIKQELDDLIQRTHQGTFYWGANEEDTKKELQKELKGKDEIIGVLKTQIATMEKEDQKKGREVDILRQSLRIICSKKGTTTPTPATVLT